MPWKYTDEYYREYTRSTWNESAEAYTRLNGMYVPFRAALIDRLAPRAGEHVLDLGSGPGEPALTVAERVGPTGRVLGVDLSPRMVELARAEADRRGLAHAEFRAMDCGRLELPSESFDAAVSCFGFQIFADPDASARECWRVLRPGGRLVAGVWSTADRVPLLDVLVGPMLEFAEPDETGYLPTPYEMGGPGELRAFLGTAGFHDAQEAEIASTARFASAEEFLEALLAGTPLGHSLAEEEPSVQARILAKARTNLERYAGPDGVALPATVLIVSAHR